MMERYAGQLKDYDFNLDIKITKAKKRGDKTRYNKYCNDILTFDIEVSSSWIDEKGNVISYIPGKSNDYWKDLQALALCYIWQFSINDKVYYGRELRDFVQVLADIPKNIEVVIWVHNLSYEFQFLKNIITWDKIFARQPHKPMKCSAKEFPNIEFRCSYMLTRLSLETWGDQLGVHKKVGDLDYEVMRTPLTPLTDTEMDYCEYDCRVVYAGIQTYLKRYGTIRNIPLTQTGTVRREVKERLTSDLKYLKFIKKLVPKNPEEYKMLMDIFAGGYTHANRAFAGMVIYDLVQHYDFASSYPTVMIAEKYPMSPWVYTGLKEIPTDKQMENNAYLIKIKFSQLKSISYNTYMQASKCAGKKIKFDNGRIISADEVTMFMTEQDYLIIRDNYTWDEDSTEVLELWRSHKRYLPKKLVEYILELYENKTSLKGVKDMEELYMQSKQYINSLFGMCVTAIIQKEVEMVNDEWKIQKLDYDYVAEQLEKRRHWSPREKRYFLNYSWGIYITAYARRNLWKCINRCDDEMLYADTDSIFVIGEHDFSWYNEEITEKLRKACEYHNIDFKRTRPKAPDGKEKPLGIFDKEDDCIEFISLGAKRYVERRKKDKKLHLTVSGINKDAVYLLLDDIENFKDGFDFDKDSINIRGESMTFINDKGIEGRPVKKNLSKYLENMPTVVYPDGYISTYRYGINMRRTGYKIKLTDEYSKLIEHAKINTGEFSDSFYNKLRSTF